MNKLSNLRRFFEEKNLTQLEIAKILGVSKAYVNALMAGRKEFGKKQAEIWENHFGLSRSWLLTGEGPMIKEEGNSGDSENRREEEPATGNEQRLIPFYDVETTGGYHGHVSASDEGRLVGYISPGGWFGDSATAAIRHVGDSMTEYPSGCVLAVREVRERRLLVPGRNYVIETREYRVTKRVQRGNYPDTLMLYSSNTSKYDDGRLIHEPFEVSFEDILHIYSVLGYIVNQSGEFKLIKP